MWRGLAVVAVVFLGVVAVNYEGLQQVFAVQNADLDSLFKSSQKQQQDGNYQLAVDGYARLLADEQTSGEIVAQAIIGSQQCFNMLQTEAKLDALLKDVIRVHGDDFRVLAQAAKTLTAAPHYGFVADEVFYRGQNGRMRVQGVYLQCQEQDRLQALHWMADAVRIADQSQSSDLGQIYLNFADLWQLGRGGNLAWLLQSKTDLTAEPNYLDTQQQASFAGMAAPVDQQDNPILYSRPNSIENAQSDGERFRWALAQAMEIEATERAARLRWARFLESQFSVQTINQDYWLHRSQSSLEKDGVFAVHTLQDNETIAKLAVGIRRFQLPDEFHHLQQYRQLAAMGGETQDDANRALINIFMNRRQYPSAAAIVEKYPKLYPGGIDAIRGPRVAFDPIKPQQAREPVRVSVLFRNASEIRFSAQQIDVERLITDTKAYYRQFSQTQRDFGGTPNKQPPNLESPGQFFSEPQIIDYLKGDLQTWTEAVQSRPNHWDRRIDVTIPANQPGLYLLEARPDASEEPREVPHFARTLVWVQDSVLIKKPLTEGTLFQFFDAETGEPISGANVEFFGWRFLPNSRNRGTQTSNRAERTNDQGELIIDLPRDFMWLTIARRQDGSLALLNFERFFPGRSAIETYDRVKAFGVAERPVYRPGEKVQTKFWLGRAVYGEETTPPVAHQSLTITCNDGQGNQVAQRRLETDEYGGCEFVFDLPESAMLGHYSFSVSLGEDRERVDSLRRPVPTPGFFGGTPQPFIETSLSIRVEEYRKPEFEVNILAPQKPVVLGETVNARIQAKYYFGAPVTDASVTVKVERTLHSEFYFPIMPYDWCYGPGYWWLAEDYPWYPNWRNWHGCLAPVRSWYPGRRYEPPELILEQELELDATGEAVVRIDTAAAKAMFGDSQDQQYTISVDVRDASRRTISAQGKVVAASQPFKIYTWVDRGFYRVGEAVNAKFHCRMLDGTSVIADGKLDLMRITYDANAQPVERIVETFDVKTDADGQGDLRFVATRAGQYRLRLRLNDSEGHEVEGGFVFTVRGEGVSGNDFRYADLELTPDRMEYQPGDTVQLQIACNQPDGLVTLFVRPEGGSYSRPEYVRLKDKSAVVEIKVTQLDQPNFFVEAHTVYQGQVYQQVREIIVPPAERVLNVEIASNKSEYLPGEDASVQLQIRTPAGEPLQGSCVIGVYDRSLEQIAADVLPPDIREFFWKWRRNHYPQLRHSLQAIFQPVSITDVPPLLPLGIYGTTVADDLDAFEGMTWTDREVGGGFQPMPGEYRRGLAGYGGEGEPFVADSMMVAEGAMLGGGIAMADGVAMAPAALARSGKAANAAQGEDGGGPPSVRKDFADAALWLANVTTDANGKATAQFKMPENLTGWRLITWTVGKQTRVGSARAEAVTRKPLLVRLQLPRFLVERDEVVLSTIVHNDFAETKTVKVTLEIDGETQLEMLPGVEREQWVVIRPFEQARVNWRCKALAAGKVIVRSSAITEGASDAMQLEMPIVVFGAFKTDSWAGTVRSGEAESKVTLPIPEQRREEHSRLIIRVSPSLAAAMLDALPYLASYPYGCTEQTLNRFLPTVITQRILQEMNLDLDVIGQQRSNLNAQELGDPRIRKSQWGENPVFDIVKVDEMVRSGIQKLTDMQNEDGGWGWFPGIQSRSSAHLTALVLRGLLIAKENDVAIVPDVIARGTQWLTQYQETQLESLMRWESEENPRKQYPDNIDALVFHVLVQLDNVNEGMQNKLFEHRTQLSVYGKALLATATHRLNNPTQTNMLLQNIEQFLVQDDENETAYLSDDSSWWYWYGSQIEASAMYLKLLVAHDPKGPTAPRLVKYLLNNRKHATYWNSTRDTALVVEAFGDYLRATQEMNAEMDVEVLLGEKRIGRIAFTPQNLFSVDNSIEISATAIPNGEHELTIRRNGTGNLYWNVYSTNFTQEDEIKEAGLEVKIERRYYHLRPTSGDIQLAGERGTVQPAKQAKYDRIPIRDLTELPSGQLVEVELLVESKNDYEYLVIEDKKPACLEAVDTSSGYFSSAGLWIYRELRDQHIGLCIERLPRGKYSIQYQLRSETPGLFTALPATIEGMYAPELVGNSRDFDLQVVD